MATKKTDPTLEERTAEIRKIARGLFDKKERRTLLRFVADFKKLNAENSD